MLDEKMNLQQALNEVMEQISEVKIFNQKTRQEIINHQIEFSQLEKKNDRLGVEYKKLKEENGIYLKKNKEFEEENAKLQDDITATIQKIDINNLLKEVDIEDMKLLAQNNKMMNMALNNLMEKWQKIQKIENGEK